MTTLEEYLNRVIDEYTAGSHRGEVQKARKEFFGAIGAVHEEDPFYENYMTAFIEWYTFDRDFKKQDLPPVRLFYRAHFKEFNQDEKKIYGNLTKSRHSMFRVKKVHSNSIVLQDLYAKERLKIESSIPTVGFKVNDFFEAILILFKGEYTFTKSFFFHPPEAKAFILKEMKRIQNLETKILQKTLMNFRRLRLKYDRYPHVDPLQIYNPEEFRKHA